MASTVRAAPGKQVKLSCSRCGEACIASIASGGVHAFICPYCGQPHLLLVDANLGLRDFRPVSSIPARKPFDVARIRVKDESLVPSHLRSLLDVVKRGVLPPQVDELIELLMGLGLLEVEV